MASRTPFERQTTWVAYLLFITKLTEEDLTYLKQGMNGFFAVPAKSNLFQMKEIAYITVVVFFALSVAWDQKL